MDGEKRKLLDRLDALASQLDKYLPGRDLYLDILISDGFEEDIQQSAGCERRLPTYSAPAGIGGGWISDQGEVWVEFCDIILRFNPGAEHEPMVVESFPDGYDRRKDILNFILAYDGDLNSHIGRFDSDFQQALHEVLAPAVSARLLKIPWTRHQRSWPLLMLRLGMAGIDPLLSTSFLRGESFTRGINRRGAGWIAKAEGKWHVGWYIASLRPDVRTATEICMAHIRRLLTGASKAGPVGVQGGGQEARGTPGEGIPDDAIMSPADLAEVFGIGQGALLGRLRRLRARDLDCFVEITERTQKEPQFLYRFGKVRHVIEAMKASSKASSKRAAKKTSP